MATIGAGQATGIKHRHGATKFPLILSKFLNATALYGVGVGHILIPCISNIGRKCLIVENRRGALDKPHPHPDKGKAIHRMGGFSMSHHPSPRPLTPPLFDADPPPLHRHAALRMKQRGVSPQILSFVLDNADRGENVGGGVEAQYLSRRRLADLRRLGAPAALLERAQRLTVLVAPSGGVVTVYRRSCNRRRAAFAAADGAVSGGDHAPI